MKVKVGDWVRFLNEVGSGRVRKVIDKKLVEIQTKDGWSIPYQISELVVIPDDPDREPFRAVSQAEEETPKEIIYPETPVSGVEAKIFLLVTQVKKEGTNLKGLQWYIVNDSEYSFIFGYYQVSNKGVLFSEKEELEPGTKMMVQESTLAELSDIQRVQIQGVLFNSNSTDVPPSVNFSMKFVVKKFSAPGSYSENDFLHEPAIVLDIFQTPRREVRSSESQSIVDVINEKEYLDNRLNQKPVYKSGIRNEPPKEVDLHINQLVDSVVGMSNREILSIQLTRFTTELNQAIADKKQHIIFIHGIGNGTLKEAVKKSLANDYPICSGEDASFKEYGFGATLVRIRQNK